jgi:transposase
VKNDKKDSRLIRFCLIGGAGCAFNNDPDALIFKSLIRQRNSLVSAKLKIDRQQADIRHKEKCLKQNINPIYQELARILKEKIAEIEKDLKLYRPGEQKLLQSIPGVGPITAASFISEVGDISRFKKPEQLVAYAGIDPRVFESGESVRGKGYISKRGNKILRIRLYNAASAAVLRDNMFKTFFQKKRSEGKPYKVALVAAMRKMAHVIHAVWTRGTPFQ